MSIKEIGECRFVARFTSLRDKKRVLDMEPWNFSNSLVLLADVIVVVACKIESIIGCGSVGGA